MKIFRSAAAIPCPRAWPSHSFGITRLTVTAPALRLMNCLLFIAIALLLIQLELRQAHDLVDESAHLLVDGRIVVRKLDFLAVVARLKIRFQFFARAAAHVQRPEYGQEFFNDLL